MQRFEFGEVFGEEVLDKVAVRRGIDFGSDGG
jgi:hypothetical protein